MHLANRKPLRRKFVYFSVLIAIVFSLHGKTVSAERSRVEFDTSKPGKIAIALGVEQVALFVYQDDKIARPYFAHIRVPDAPQVTRNHPPIAGRDKTDHGSFHPGLWMSFGDISGSDYWRLAARTTCEISQQPSTDGKGNGAFSVHNRYFDQQDDTKIVCEEDCRFTFLVKPEGFLLLWDSTFYSAQEFYFGDQEEMGLGFRLATPIRVDSDTEGGIPKGNGKILDSTGRINGEQVWGNSADWCDYSGTLDGKRIGITLFCHPNNLRPSWFHARDYGFMAANLFGRKAFSKGEPSRVVVKPDDRFRLRYGVYVHATPKGNSPDLASAYNDYLRTSGE